MSTFKIIKWAPGQQLAASMLREESPFYAWPVGYHDHAIQ